MKTHTLLATALLVSGGIANRAVRIYAQEPAGVGSPQVQDSHTPSPNSASTGTTLAQKRITYVRPTEKTKLRNYLFDAYGPYPIAGAAIVAGINQVDGTPPEWGGGAEAYGKRVGSNYGINAITTTTRYALSEVLHQDTLYYRCQCKGFFPRLGHALVSTLAARHGEDGHYTFSVPALVAPY